MTAVGDNNNFRFNYCINGYRGDFFKKQDYSTCAAPVCSETGIKSSVGVHE